MKRSIVLTAIIILAACSVQPTPEAIQTTAVPATTLTPTSTRIPPTETPTPYPTPDLNKQPMVWFGPLPPMQARAGRPFIGADDYQDLFKPNAPWQWTAAHIAVFKIYAEWVASAEDSEIKPVIDFVNQHGLALGMEDGPIHHEGKCGSGRESTGGPDNGYKLAQKIKRLGGRLYFIDMDTPYYQYSLNEEPGACRWSAEKVASKINTYIKSIQRVFPDVVVGDIEVMHRGMDPMVYAEWLVTFRETTGKNLPFLHMDIDYAGKDWAERIMVLEERAEAEGVDFGIIFFGNWDDLSDEAWLSNTGERVKHYEAVSGGLPQHVFFQSWHNRPDASLPESDPYTYSGFVKQFFEDRSKLGFRSEGAGANLAIGKEVRVSRFLQNNPGENAVDGDPGTIWSAGDFARQWIQIDLGAPYTLREIRLMLNQSPAGRTVHIIYVQGPGTGGDFIQLVIFDGETDSMDVLVHTPGEALEGIQIIRVETIASPSWIGFSEIEVIAAE